MGWCRTLFCVLASVWSFTLFASPAQAQQLPYGVFIGAEEADVLPVSEGYETIVVEGLSFAPETIQSLKARGQFVYSYLSVGSLETYRDYYETFKDLAIAPYENWPDEFWIDAASQEWGDFIVGTLARDLVAKGVDGFFLDNFDVYGLYPSDAAYDGLIRILQGLREFGLMILINGGDEFVTRLIDEKRHALIDGVNQESVYTRVLDYDRDLFSAQTPDDEAYFRDYLAQVKSVGLDVYLLEYSRDEVLIAMIREEAASDGFTVYISPSLALDGN